MRFTRLKLVGFKSFVETTEFLIEPGLTGIVGPNGCGKSNLLEGLRWVMGATSAKAMRGEGMDDVIFAGADARPARGHAEVTLTVENDDAAAPGPFRFEPILEVSRRIDRGEGSTYRINGSEVRARDVQLLFADASTGANSPSLVRQGQISELIAAKPQNRRRILEEAAGVSGLHSRRHEAELRVAAAQTNLTRLEDVARELETALARLRREARAAARYKALGAEIRGWRAAVLHGKWRRTVEAEREAVAAWKKTDAANQTAAREAALATTEALGAAEALRPLRDEQTVAVTVHQRLVLEADRVERALVDARAVIARHEGELARGASDIERESRACEEASAAAARGAAESAALETQIRDAPERGPALEAEWRAAETRRQAAEAAVEALATQLAIGRAAANAARDQKLQAESRLRRLVEDLGKARSDREGLGEGPDAALAAAERAREDCDLALDRWRERVETAEAARTVALTRESAARTAARAAEEALAEASVEHRALARLSAPPSAASGPSLLDRLSTHAGYELALAAALGDDLNAGLAPNTGAFWSEAGERREPTAAINWPAGARPIGEFVTAPRRLSARLELTALVEREDAEALQAELPVGARLVSRDGGLWRWDGYVVWPGAPSPAAARLRQKARLDELASRIEALEPSATQAKTAQATAAAALAKAEATARALRGELSGLERERAHARDVLEDLRRAEDQKSARRTALEEAVARLEAEIAESKAVLEAVIAKAPQSQDDSRIVASLDQARERGAKFREAAALARSAFDLESRERAARTRRLEELRADAAAWRARAERSRARNRDLDAERDKLERDLAAARSAPSSIEAAREQLLGDLGVAEARRSRADDAIAAAEARRTEADRLSHAADARAADARELRAAAVARLEAARQRVGEAFAAVVEGCGLTPDEVGANLANDPAGADALTSDGETRLAALEREQGALGAVNLLAADEAAEVAERLRVMAEERDDLVGAIGRLRQGIAELNAEGRERLNAAFLVIDSHFRELFTALFQGGAAELRLVESDDPLEAGLEIYACPPGKRMAVMSLMSGGEQALTAVALIFAVFLANPAPICVLDEVDAPLDDANVERFCNLLAEMRQRAATRFITITHNPLTMSRMDRLFGVTMHERGVSQLVSVDLTTAEALAER